MVSFSSSTFVQTVSINYEDFNESFLTCGTCLCLYDAGEHSPKLLPCSHTICRQCLEQIVSSNPIPVTMLTSISSMAPAPSNSSSSASSSNSTTPALTSTPEAHHHHHVHQAFRCPICRESIPIPVGGVSALRPNFLVNQLLDLMAQQRREVVPKCSIHSMQELLFCETCDVVFCQDCNGANHSSPTDDECETGTTDPHTVIPFSIAIKRMSEILLYKAKLCIKKLNEANAAVSAELAELDARASATEAAIAAAFDDVLQVVEERREALLGDLGRMAAQKRAVLVAQADEIRHERSLVEAEVDALHREVEVRTISGKIGELTAKLETLGLGGVGEPRENSFLCFEAGLVGACLTSVRDCLAGFGAVRTSTTHPSLSSLVLPSPRELVTNLECRAKVMTVDYDGRPRCSGSDPVEAKLVALSAGGGGRSSVPVPVRVVDNEDGTYDLSFVPVNACQHKIEVRIFNRPLKDSPAYFEASPHVNPEVTFGHRGHASSGDEECFLQPVSAAYDPGRGVVFVLDSGNSRIKVLKIDGDGGLKFDKHLDSRHVQALEGGSATGLALCPDDGRLAVVNWRTRKVTKFDPDHLDDCSTEIKTLKTEYTSEELKEPTGVAVASDGSLLVIDNAAKMVAAFSPEGKFLAPVTLAGVAVSQAGLGSGSTSKNDKAAASLTVSAVAFGPEDEPVVADSRIRVYEPYGRIREIYPEGKGRGSFGGLAIDASTDTLLATRSEKTRTCVMVFDFSTGKLRFVVDSPEEKLRRPAGVAVLPEGRFLVVDWGNDCVRKYRYR